MKLDNTGTIVEGYHIAANLALKYIQRLGLKKLYMYLESFSSCAIEGNDLAGVCAGTLRRVLNRQKLGDRYVLGLAWILRNMEEEDMNSTELQELKKSRIPTKRRKKSGKSKSRKTK